jgi:rRNA large subunit m3Psi methyltransferase RlmH
MAALSWLTPSHFIMVGLLVGFAIAHSGLAALRPKGRSADRCPRLSRLVCSGQHSLCQRADHLLHHSPLRRGKLWNVQGVPGMTTGVWIASAISFIFLYPATFNLLEIAALQKPEIHLYETGIIRITRHPQMVGQVLWCIAHTLWLGTTFMLVTSAGLIAHHLFAVWHGDRRWQAKYGDAFLKVKERTSVIPFLAILQGRQELKLLEFVKPAYLGILLFIARLLVGASQTHSSEPATHLVVLRGTRLANDCLFGCEMTSFPKIKLLAIGKVKKSWIREGIEMYHKRLPELTMAELKDTNPDKEGEQILAQLKDRDRLIALTEEGQCCNSGQFAELISRAESGSLVFAIGSAEGLSPSVKRSADRLLSLSPMTFPHEMARLLLLEQLYRAKAIPLWHFRFTVFPTAARAKKPLAGWNRTASVTTLSTRRLRPRPAT